ncbi:FHA domain-containing protein [Subtercola sp. PAMC28395]|uniref:FtsK/SpoIIIE domain-containing protein n=1 Tax=Subtercola sp. PAMC28395 TaxID=2846775 RepID=UPI001C0C55EE|nr:FtsK/SpoIIIE domain-containing protein [Subtercola sp. PAMC28395]QWT24549.1 FHA domain-containing protein [Subtercola sp. PAMC28395]
MRVKVTLKRAGESDVDVEITADSTALVKDIASALFVADPLRSGATEEPNLTIQTGGTNATGVSTPVRLLDPDSDLAESGLRSGSSIELVYAGSDFIRPGEQRGQAAARVTVVAGPDRGKTFDLPFGASTIGRDYGVDVRLGDSLVSKRHARVNVSEYVEIIDLESANGTLLGGQQIVRASLTSSDVVTVGETMLSVAPLLRLGSAEQSGSVVEFVRNPRVVARFPGIEIVAPTPPKLPARQRFPYLSIVAPIIMGVVLYVITQQLASLLFVALSPLLIVGTFIDTKLSNGRMLKSQTQQFGAAMEASAQRQAQAHAAERAARNAESPSVTEVVESMRRHTPTMWAVRPEHETFLTARLGTGTAPSRSSLVLPGSNETLPVHWARLEAAAIEFSTIDDVPFVVDWRSTGALGLAGSRDVLDGVARGVVLHVAGLHSPAELVIAAIVSARSLPVWEWLKWMPHTSSAHSPLVGDHLADNPVAVQALLARLEELIEQRTAGAAPAPRGRLKSGAAEAGDDENTPLPFLPSVIVIIENDAQIDRARATRLAERGADANVHFIWCAASADQLPAVCRTFLSLTPDGDAAVGHVRLGEQSHPIRTETVDLNTAHLLARALSPVIDVGSPVDDESDLPRSIAYSALSGPELINEPAAVIDRWRENGSLVVRDGSPPVRRKAEGNLRALVGYSGTGAFHLDLRTQGPHALVGGTTGAGKSEFLQSWVLGLAAAHSPDRVTFLFVDYKGGAAFADCVLLPHTVGLVTDLSPHLVRRALTSLRAELRFREHLLQRKKAKDLVSLEKQGDPETPPSLLIFVDEFAALATEVPEFVDGIVDVAQRGRSLGLHLILATQRPAGVIKDNLRANTNLRIALRMADAEDSTDILGTPIAASFDPTIPGRGTAKTGPGRLAAFQTGYAGGWTDGEPPRPRVDIREIGFGSGAVWDVPELEAAVVADPGPTDISRIVSTIARASEGAGVPAPRRPWLDELAAVYDFRLVPNPRTDARLVIGVVDDPASQSQPTCFYEPDRDGNMAIFGTGGSGKSAALRTIAVAASVTLRGGPVQVYGLDFGAGGLRMLKDLPHVGSIVSGDDDERVVRLLRKLRDLVEDRAKRYAELGAGTIGEYRQLASKPAEPRILLLIDGMAAFREAYEFASNSSWFTVFAQIAADGRQLGVHIVMTGDRPNSIPTSIGSTVQKRIVLRLATEDDYLMLGVAKDVLTMASPPGRGIVDGNEVQLAILGSSSNVAVQARQMKALGASMQRQKLAAAPPIERLGDMIPLASLPGRDGDGSPVIGVEDAYLSPIGIGTTGTFMLSGPPGSGRTTALATIADSLRRDPRIIHLAFFSPRRTPLSRGRTWDASATDIDAASASAAALIQRLESGQLEPGSVAILIENVTEYTGSDAEAAIDRLIKMAARTEQLVVGESETSTWSQAWTLAAPFKAGRRGLLLTPGDLDGDTLLGTSTGRIRRADFPPGRGFLVAGGRSMKIQVAISES